MIRRLAPIMIGVFFILVLAPLSASAQVKQTSPAEALEKVIFTLASQASDLKKSLAVLKDLDEERAGLRLKHLQFLDGVLDYYRSLEVAEDSSNVKVLATKLKEKREEISPEIRKISEFILVFQAKGALKTASNRLVKINSDLNRLDDLKIFKKEKAEFLLNEALLSLTGAGDLISQAEELLATTSKARLEIRDLVGEAISKIKTAYKKFLEISSLLKDALK